MRPSTNTCLFYRVLIQGAKWAGAYPQTGTEIRERLMRHDVKARSIRLIFASNEPIATLSIQHHFTKYVCSTGVSLMVITASWSSMPPAKELGTSVICLLGEDGTTLIASHGTAARVGGSLRLFVRSSRQLKSRRRGLAFGRSV